MQNLIIIGGGYIGAWCAYFAAKSYPDWEISILDKSILGSGASRYSADLDFPNNRTEVTKEISDESRRYFEEIKSEISDFPSIKVRAYAIGNSSGFDQNNLRKNAAGTQAKNTSLQISGKNFVLKKEQRLVKLTECYRANAKTSIPKLIYKAKQIAANTRVIEQAKVIDVVYDSNTNINKVIVEDKRVFYSRFVITAVGPWALEKTWIKYFRTEWRIKKIVCFYVLLPPDDKDSVLYLLDDDAFLMPMKEEKKWLLSITSYQWDCIPEEELKINPDETKNARSILSKYAPDLVPYLAPGRVFCDTYSTSRSPESFLAINNNTHMLVGGSSGSGYRLAPAVAKRTIESLI
ncbi:FAD-dependent oxidoreductase [Aquimarina sediminis]|uniref:FAD-dependent oxidoreductase n=1 Tax=Aquimarina sediminis TaxID=2070536 RepID=UPI0013E8F20A|nr:FAD-dependent oxidoreductase [Aquimarina sediminis]